MFYNKIYNIKVKLHIEKAQPIPEKIDSEEPTLNETYSSEITE